ncbi:hypothetical protein HYW99_02435, partial [Candidatus Woesearchaeota archaeon]|nr:hypothetical protein [Candidatus Woesearchaeota archaeon]
MEGGERLLSQSSNERTVALATKHDNTKEIRILVGRYGQIIKTSKVTIEITNYPYTNIKKVKVNIQKIPSRGNEPTFLPQPI